jgi:hypothetical protein
MKRAVTIVALGALMVALSAGLALAALLCWQQQPQQPPRHLRLRGGSGYPPGLGRRGPVRRQECRRSAFGNTYPLA